MKCNPKCYYNSKYDQNLDKFMVLCRSIGISKHVRDSDLETENGGNLEGIFERVKSDGKEYGDVPHPKKKKFWGGKRGFEV